MICIATEYILAGSTIYTGEYYSVARNRSHNHGYSYSAMVLEINGYGLFLVWLLVGLQHEGL